MNDQSIFIIDDDPMLVKALTRRISNMGYAVQCANDGLDALPRITVSAPNLIIIDLNIPHANGFIICEKLNADERLNKIPKVLITGLDEEKIQARCNALNVSYIQKNEELWPRLQALISDIFSPEGAATSARASLEETPCGIPTGPLVLAVDDDPDILRALKVSCEAVGLRFKSANNAKDGFLFALSQHPDVIISDYSMPEGSGLYFIQRLRNSVATQHIPVIYLTGQVLEENRKDMDLTMRLIRQDGVVAFLQKPLNFRDLYEVFEKKLQFNMSPLSVKTIRATQKKPAGQRLFGG